MRKSLMEGDMKGRCFICGAYGPTEKHHIFGAANRQRSEHYGLFVHLCHHCHNEPPNGVHFNKDNDSRLKKKGQQAWEEKCMYEHRCNKQLARDAFMKQFGKNYDY